MRGFDIEMTKKSKAANGGMVRGKGTGTSDSIKKDARVGSYIMPADSTEAIGEQTLAGMGKKVPVAVSNGEFEMPPEQVHAIGVQALDQIKNATHTPVSRGLPGYTPQNQEPRQFFASGGAVDDMSRWQAASDALRQSNDRIAASQGRVNMQAPDGRFDEAKLAQAANMVQQSRLRMGTQAPVSNPNGSMNMQRVAALSNMVADSRARGFAPEAARQYRENRNIATAMASNDPNRPRGLPGYQPRQYFSRGGEVIDPKRPNWTYYQAPEPQPTRAVAVDTRPNFTIPPNEPPRPSTRIDTSSAQDTKFISDRGPGNPNTGGAAKMSKEAQAFMAQRSGGAAPSAAPATAPQGQGAMYRAGQSLGKASSGTGGVIDYATGGGKGALGKATGALGRAVGLYQVADDVKANFDAYKSMVESGTATPSDYVAGGVEMIGNTVGSGVLNLGKKFPVIGPMLASTANEALGQNASGRLATGFVDAMDNAGVLSRYGLGAAGKETAAASVPPAANAPAASVPPADNAPAANAPAQNSLIGKTVVDSDTSAKPVSPGIYQHGRGQFSDNPDGMGFASGFTGQPSEQNMAAMDSLASRSANQVSGMAAQQMQPQQARGFDAAQAPTVLHSGNDWQARNDLRNLRVGMDSMRSTNASRAAMRDAYRAALDADGKARAMEGEAGVRAMQANAELQQRAMSEAGANQRAADNNALEAQRIGIAGQDAVFNRGVKGFDIQNAQRKQYIQSLMDAATTPEERKAIAERFPDVYAGDKEGWKGIELSGGTDALGNKLPSSMVLYNPSTGETRAMGQGAGGASQPDTPIPQAASERVVGQIYTAPNGQKVKWDGKGFLPV